MSLPLLVAAGFVEADPEMSPAEICGQLHPDELRRRLGLSPPRRRRWLAFFQAQGIAAVVCHVTWQDSP